MDGGTRLTDQALKKLEKRIRKEYVLAEKQIEERLKEHWRLFAQKDKARRRQLLEGKITHSEYIQWRAGQMATGKRWEDMRDVIARDLVNTNEIAKSTSNGYRPEVYAIGHNWTAYSIEKDLGMNTSFSLYNAEAVERIFRDNPRILPPPGKRMLKKIEQGKAIRWQAGQIQSVTMQSIIQGESVVNAARRIASTLGEKNMKSAMRYARTAINGAENAGRLDALHYAQEIGVKVEKQWFATMDDRTRKAHRELDGQTVPLDEPFVNSLGEIMFPGDTDAKDADNYWNCRCSMAGVVRGFAIDAKDLSRRNTDHFNYKSYDDWKHGKEQSQDILKPLEVEDRMKKMYASTYRR